MAISSRDYAEWRNTYWLPLDLPVRKLMDSVDNLSASLHNYDSYNGPDFGDLVADMTPDGIPTQLDNVRRAIADAKANLEQLHTDQQRAVTTGRANQVIDDAITSRDQLCADIEHLRLDLIPRVTMSYDSYLAQVKGTVGEDKLDYRVRAVMKLQTEYGRDLDTARSAIYRSGQKADEDAERITRIADEDLTISQPIAAAPVRTSMGLKTSMTRDRVDSTIVDRWNEKALKMLDEGDDCGSAGVLPRNSVGGWPEASVLDQFAQ